MRGSTLVGNDFYLLQTVPISHIDDCQVSCFCKTYSFTFIHDLHQELNLNDPSSHQDRAVGRVPRRVLVLCFYHPVRAPLPPATANY